MIKTKKAKAKARYEKYPAINVRPADGEVIRQLCLERGWSHAEAVSRLLAAFHAMPKT